jgi:hypothetical protein
LTGRPLDEGTGGGSGADPPGRSSPASVGTSAAAAARVDVKAGPSRLYPDDRQHVLLRAALLTGPEALGAWQVAARWLDPGRMDPGSKRLLPLVWANLTRQGVCDPALERLAGSYQDTRVQVDTVLAAAGRLLAGLHTAGIPTVVLKGGALVAGYYRDPGLRPMSDLDVLVPTGAATTARGVLQEHGWSPRARWSAGAVRMTHAAVFDPADDGPPVDLHWHVFAECCRPADDAALWERSIAIEIGGVATRALSPADQLMHVCVHGEKWVHVPGIRWVADAVTVIRAAAIDWAHLVEEAARRRFGRRLASQLTFLRHALEAPVPAEVLTALSTAPVSPLEWLEHALGVRERRPPNSLLAHWFTHARSAPAGAVGSLLSFPRYLQAIWHLESLSAVPGAILTRLRGRLPSSPGPGR